MADEQQQDQQQQQDPKWEVVRRAAPEESSPAVPLIGLALLLVLGIGGYLMFGSNGNETKGGDDPDTTTSLAPDTPPPDYVWEPIDFAEEQGQLSQALQMIEDALEDYPDSRELKSRKRDLEEELGISSGADERSAAQLTRDAKELIAEDSWEEALDLLDLALEEDDEDPEIYYLRGQCLGEMGEQLDAMGSLRDAKDLGYDPAKVDALLRRYE